MNVDVVFLKKCGVFERTLSPANDSNSFSYELAGIVNFRRVWGEFWRDREKLLGTMKKGSNAEGQHHRSCLDSVAVIEPNLKDVADLRNGLDNATVNSRSNLCLEPVAVCDEVLNRQRVG